MSLVERKGEDTLPINNLKLFRELEAERMSEWSF